MEVGLIAQVIGRERALFLAGKTAGVLLTIPFKPTENHKLAQVIGMEDALKLSREYPGWVIKLPRCWNIERQWRNTEINRLYAEGYTLDQLAEIFQVSRRTVQYVTYDRRTADAV